MEKKIYNLENNAVDVYFQKSAKFLFPLLKIPSQSIFQQIQSYVSWQGEINICESKLICVYELSKQTEYCQFEEDLLFKNEYFESFFKGAENKGIYIFNLESYKVDFDKFLKGKYSLLSPDAKDLIKDYFKLNSNALTYMDSFLYPDQYFEKYAALLNIDEWRLRSIGELADPLNKIKETLFMQKTDKITVAA